MCGIEALFPFGTERTHLNYHREFLYFVFVVPGSVFVHFVTLFFFPSFLTWHSCRFPLRVPWEEGGRVLNPQRCQDQTPLRILVVELMMCLLPESIGGEIPLNILILYLSSWRISWQVHYEDTKMSQHREMFGMTRAFLLCQLGGYATGEGKPRSTLCVALSHKDVTQMYKPTTSSSEPCTSLTKKKALFLSASIPF